MKDTIKQKFTEKFQSEPKLFFSPGRINLLGEHIDYNDGFVLPAAIDKGLWFAVAANNTNNIRFFASDLNEEYQTSLDEVEPYAGWPNYCLGVIAQFQKTDKILKGFDCAFGGNLPKGAGLSSSAALTCGLAFSLNEIFSFQLDRKTLALMAQKAEHEYPKVMCGIMDQFANLFGKKNNIIRLDCNSLEHQYLPLSSETHAVILIDSNVEHALNSGEYNLRRQQCEFGLSIIKKLDASVKTFRDVKPAFVREHKNEFDEVVYNRCLYVTEEIERTQKAVPFLSDNNVEEFGKLMYATHEGLSKLYNVSTPELDWLVEKAKQMKITGSRLMGGGFGGCTINLIPKEIALQTAEQILKDYKKQFNIETVYYAVAPSEGTHAIS
jgi:galactokinase